MNISHTILAGISIIVAIMIHELAHGYIALRFGDTTAKDDGRLSLNPLNHLDPLGTLSLIIFNFGWAKPVPVNFSKLRPQKIGTVAVSLAGCIANFLTAIVVSILYMVQVSYFGENYLSVFFLYLIIYSISFGVFNLVPIPPLDGSKVVLVFLPKRIQFFVYKNEKYIHIVFLIFVISGFLPKITRPVINFLLSVTLYISARIVI